MPKEEVVRKIDEITEVLKLGDFIDNRIERLSTGQTQRISIARCLLHSPRVYIFDEPTLGLDIISSRAIIEFMKAERAAGKAVLYSTHYMEEAEFLCDRIIMLHKGRIIAQGTPGELLRQTSTDNLRDAFLSLINEEEM
jgi:sodium transport system ATP-binding protein